MDPLATIRCSNARRQIRGLSRSRQRNIQGVETVVEKPRCYKRAAVISFEFAARSIHGHETGQHHGPLALLGPFGPVGQNVREQAFGQTIGDARVPFVFQMHRIDQRSREEIVLLPVSVDVE